MPDYLKLAALLLGGATIAFGLLLVLLLSVVDIAGLPKKFRWVVLVRLIFFGFGGTGLVLAFLQIVEQVYLLLVKLF